MTGALYATIWTSMALFVAGELAKAYTRDRPAKWPWLVWAAGVLLCVVHMAIAMAVRYSWNFDEAARDTAARAAAVYGFSWHGSLYVNYLFTLMWLGETAWWAASPLSYAARPAALVWVSRLFYFVVVFNAVVIFARTPARPVGVALVAILALAWAGSRIRQGFSGSRQARTMMRRTPDR